MKFPWDRSTLDSNKLLGQERKRQLEFVRSLSGFKLLTPKQQKIIEHSLFIQERALRQKNDMDSFLDEDLSDISNPLRMLFTNHDMLKNSSNRDSAAVVVNYMCHYAVYLLENEISFQKVSTQDISDKLDHVNYRESTVWNSDIKQFDDAENFFEENEKELTPGILTVYNTYDQGKKLRLLHSATILGKDSKGEVYLWEKESPGKPFQIISLRDVLSRYEFNFGPVYFGFRKMKGYDCYK